MLETFVTRAQAQNNFIRSTAVLKASFLKTPTPSIGEISRLAAQTGLDDYCVSTWFDIIRGLKEDGANALLTPEVTRASVPQRSDLSKPEDSHPPLIESYRSRSSELGVRPSQKTAISRRKKSSTGTSRPRKRQRKEESSRREVSVMTLDNRQKVSRRRPSKPAGEIQYCCPTCKFTTAKMDQWYTHQSRVHFPSEAFICGMNSETEHCNMGPDRPCRRKDNFMTHLQGSHGLQPGETLDQEVSRRTFKVTGLFHDRCGFCSVTLDSRETSLEHIVSHIKAGDEIEYWTHQCTSLEHKLQDHVNFKTSPDESETDNDNPHDDNNDGDQDNDNPTDDDNDDNEDNDNDGDDNTDQYDLDD